jgi:uncharacterized protein YciI
MKNLVFALLSLTVLWLGAAKSADAPSDIRVVIIHAPGPAWKTGVPFRQQVGVQAHVDYYRKALAVGLLSLGGPFLDDTGGMMISKAGAKFDDMREFANSDPAVKSGLLIATVHTWMVAMHGDTK